MQYILIHNMPNEVKGKIINGYLKSGFKIAFENENNILIKKTNRDLVDEETYIRITLSIINKITNLNKKGKVIDLTKAFEYADTKKEYNMFNNKFDWYIRNIITSELI